MKTRPILFSGPMVLALLDGTKTQTRKDDLTTMILLIAVAEGEQLKDIHPPRTQADDGLRHSRKTVNSEMLAQTYG